MYLTLFVVFIGLSLLLVTLGLFRPEHTELALIGFVFLFLLSFSVINEDLSVKSGVDITYNHTLVNGSYEVTSETQRTSYEDVTLGGNLDHLIGYYLAILSVVGFVAVIIGIRRSRNYE